MYSVDDRRLIGKPEPPKSGIARMWIINNEMRPFHYDKIKIGTKGHFREGGTFSADCEVIEILDLKNNPTENK